MNRPTFANIVGTLFDSLEAMAGYLDVSAFRETIVERNKCRETLKLELVEEQSLCQVLSDKQKCQDAPVPDEFESTV